MFARRIAVIGSGYVGLTTGACLASLGHEVVCADIDAAKVDRLRRGEVDILEPGLPELVVENLAAGRLDFVVGARAAVARAGGDPVEVVFLCVPTPMGEGGAADLRCGARRRRGGPPPAAVGLRRREQVDGAGRHGAGDASPARAPRHRGGEQPRVPARGHGGARLPAPGPHRRRGRRPGRRRAGRGALLQARRADGAHRRGQRRDGQVRGQLLPRDEALLRQRPRRAVRRAGRRRRRRHRGHGLRPPDRAGVPAAGPGLGRILPAQGHPRAAAGGGCGRVGAAAGQRQHRDERRGSAG